MVGDARGVIGINAVLVSPSQENATLDRYVDHIEHVIDLIGIDCVGIGFDFFEFIYRQLVGDERVKFAPKVSKRTSFPIFCITASSKFDREIDRTRIQ